MLFGVCRLQCCGLKVGETPTAVPQRPELGGDGQGDRGSGSARLTAPDGFGDNPKGDDMLAHKRSTSIDTHAENGLTSCSGKLSKTPMAVRSSASIRDKISQWEGKSESTVGSCPATAGQRETDSVRKKDIKSTEIQRRDSRRLVSWERQESGKENGGKTSDSRPMSPEGFTRDRESILDRGLRGKMAETVQDKKSVSTHIKKLEQAMKEVPSKPSIAFPGNYFCPPSKEEQEEAERKGAEPIFGTLDVARSTSRSRRSRDGDPENVYTEPGAPSINPVPKPQRTFQHHTPTGTPVSAGGSVKSRRNLPPLPSIPPPPLPTCPPPGVCRRPWADRPRDNSNRYGFFMVFTSSIG